MEKETLDFQRDQERLYKGKFKERKKEGVDDVLGLLFL